MPKMLFPTYGYFIYINKREEENELQNWWTKWTTIKIITKVINIIRTFHKIYFRSKAIGSAIWIRWKIKPKWLLRGWYFDINDQIRVNWLHIKTALSLKNRSVSSVW